MAFAIGYTSPITLLSDRITGIQSSSNTLPQAVGIASSGRSLFTPAAELLDNLALDKVDIVNYYKQEIVSAGLAATNSCLQSRWPPYVTDPGYTGTPSDATLKSSVDNLFGDIIVGTAKTALGTVVGLTTTGMVGFGSVREDLLRAYYYPKIENEQYDTDNPFQNQNWITITTGNLGIGASVNVWVNPENGSLIGTVYSLIDTGSPCNTSSTSIGSSITTLKIIREEALGLTTSNTILKDQKTSYDLQIWSYNRTIQTNTTTVTGLTSAISILQQYEGQY
jgi:hypothetical protein